MSNIPSFPYVDLWNERVITSVANLTRHDGEEFFGIVQRVPLSIRTEIFPLEQVNIAMERFRTGELHGTAVVVIIPKPPVKIHNRFRFLRSR
jgi:propanol-preferring alcohol dehydrogenase